MSGWKWHSAPQRQNQGHGAGGRNVESVKARPESWDPRRVGGSAALAALQGRVFAAGPLQRQTAGTCRIPALSAGSCMRIMCHTRGRLPEPLSPPEPIRFDVADRTAARLLPVSGGCLRGPNHLAATLHLPALCWPNHLDNHCCPHAQHYLLPEPFAATLAPSLSIHHERKQTLQIHQQAWWLPIWRLLQILTRRCSAGSRRKKPPLYSEWPPTRDIQLRS